MRKPIKTGVYFFLNEELHDAVEFALKAERSGKRAHFESFTGGGSWFEPDIDIVTEYVVAVASTKARAEELAKKFIVDAIVG